LAFLSTKRCEKVYVSDLNSNIIFMYQNIQSNVKPLIQELSILHTEYNSIQEQKTKNSRNPTSFEEAKLSQESYYYWNRSKFNHLSKEELSSPKSSALVIFLNKTCFRGLYREGPNGFNVPFGHYKNVDIVNEEHLLKLSLLIRDVKFSCCSFETVLNDIISCQKKNCFVYLDPPYVPEKITSFTGYTNNGFEEKIHQTLFRLCGEMEKQNINFLLSNSNTELVRNSFSQERFSVFSIECKRSIHSKKPNSKTTELLITNKLMFI